MVNGRLFQGDLSKINMCGVASLCTDDSRELSGKLPTGGGLSNTYDVNDVNAQLNL